MPATGERFIGRTREVLQPGTARPDGSDAESCPRRGATLKCVLECAMREYLENRALQKVRPEVMAHFRASLEKNRRLVELFAR